MNSTSFGQYLPRNSLIHSLDPRTKILMVFILMIFSLAADTFIGGLLLAAYTISLVWISNVPLMWYLKGCRPLIGLILIAVAFQLFLTPGRAAVQWWILKITVPGIYMAGLLAYRLSMIYLLAALLTCTTSPMQLTDGLERLFRPFKKVGLPVEETAMVMMIAIRFIPVFFEESEKVIRAQLSRGADINTGSLARMGNMVSILVPLFTRAIRRADELALAMEVRGYSVGIERTRMHEIVMQSADYWLMALTAVLSVTAWIL